MKPKLMPRTEEQQALIDLIEWLAQRCIEDLVDEESEQLDSDSAGDRLAVERDTRQASLR